MVIVLADIVCVQVPATRYLDGVRVDKTTALNWIGMYTNVSTTVCFYYLLPLLATLGPGRALVEDFISGFQRHLVQAHPYRYLVRNIGATLIGGFMTAALPLTVDYLFCRWLLPNIKPDVILNYGLGPTLGYTYFVHLFYQHSGLVIGFYIVLAGVMTALFALAGALVGLVTLNQYSMVVTPMVITLIWSVFATSYPQVGASPLTVMIAQSPTALPSLFALGIALCATLVLMIGGMTVAFNWRTTK